MKLVRLEVAAIFPEADLREELLLETFYSFANAAIIARQVTFASRHQLHVDTLTFSQGLT